MTDFNPFAESTGSFERELIPEGPHAARCVRIIEIGEQHSPIFDKKDEDGNVIEKSIANKAVIVFAIPGVTMEINGEEKQKFISNPFGITISNNERSTMRQYARALCPDGGESLDDFLNRTCQVYVKHIHKNDKTNDRLDSVAPLLPGIEVPEADMPVWRFKWNEPDPNLWELIPEFQQEMIKEAVNYPGSAVEQMVNGSYDTTPDM